MNHGAPQGAAVVVHQVNLQVSRWRPIPIGEGRHPNIAAQRLLPPASEPAARRCPDGLEQSVQGGGAGCQQPLAHPRVQIQVAMALHGLHQVGQCRLEPFPADPVSSFPDQDDCFSHSLVVDAPALHGGLLLSVVAGLPQQPDAMLPVVASYRDELVQNPAFLPLG